MLSLLFSQEMLRKTSSQVSQGMSSSCSNVSTREGPSGGQSLEVSDDSLLRVLRVTMEVTLEHREDPPKEHVENIRGSMRRFHL